jgi:hypothetical protein
LGRRSSPSHVRRAPALSALLGLVLGLLPPGALARARSLPATPPLEVVSAPGFPSLGAYRFVRTSQWRRPETALPGRGKASLRVDERDFVEVGSAQAGEVRFFDGGRRIELRAGQGEAAWPGRLERERLKEREYRLDNGWAGAWLRIWMDEGVLKAQLVLAGSGQPVAGAERGRLEPLEGDAAAQPPELVDARGMADALREHLSRSIAAKRLGLQPGSVGPVRTDMHGDVWLGGWLLEEDDAVQSLLTLRPRGKSYFFWARLKRHPTGAFQVVSVDQQTLPARAR